MEQELGLPEFILIALAFIGLGYLCSCTVSILARIIRIYPLILVVVLMLLVWYKALQLSQLS